VTLPSLTRSAKVARFSLFTKSLYAKYGFGKPSVRHITLCFDQVEHAGRSHSRSTAFLAQALHVSMQFSKSVAVPSFEKVLMRISAGSRLIGGWHRYSWGTAVVSNVCTPIEDCESLLLLKKSDSSYSALVGELLDEECESSSWSAALCGVYDDVPTPMGGTRGVAPPCIVYLFPSQFRCRIKQDR
jgi:hypothetical protein